MSSLQVGTILGNIVRLKFSSLADVLYIYPHKKKKKAFQDNREEFNYIKKANEQAAADRLKQKQDYFKSAQD